MSRLNRYVCCLDETTQTEILREAREILASLAYPVDMEMELENVNQSKLIDLQDLLDVFKYA